MSAIGKYFQDLHYGVQDKLKGNLGGMELLFFILAIIPFPILMVLVGMFVANQLGNIWEFLQLFFWMVVSFFLLFGLGYFWNIFFFYELYRHSRSSWGQL